MKRKLFLILCGIMIAIIFGTSAYLVISQNSDDTTDTGMSEDDEENYETIVNTVYNVEAQAEIMEELEEEKEDGNYTEENMLVEYNPFGTNSQSLYVYFETDEGAKVTYTVSVNDDDIADFSREVEQDEEYETVHEFQVIGLIPDVKNTVTFTITFEDGYVGAYKTTITPDSLLGDEELQLEKTDYIQDTDEESETSETEAEESETESTEASTADLEDGLYVILGNGNSEGLNFMYYYDNDGVLRSEIPIIEYRSHRLLFDETDDSMLFSISYTQIARMNDLGQITEIYDLGDYKLHHDYVYDDDGNMLILATDTNQETKQDIVILLDLESGEVSEIIDFGDYFTEYKDECVARTEEDELTDWFHLNCIQYIGDDSILLSSRETSTIVKVSNIYDDPEIEYLIGSEELWEEIGYADLVLEQVGDFTLQGGQHCITYVEDDTLEDGQYYLYMFNNNIGISESNPDFDWSSIGLTEDSSADGDTSYYYEYLVDENEGTFTLVDSFEVPYSGYVSSVQNIGSNTVVDSGAQGIFSEYDEDHNLIASFKMDTDVFIYRVFKYDF